MKSEIQLLLHKNPGLKGKEIAKRLNLDKKSVNSFLHHDDSGLCVQMIGGTYQTKRRS